MIQAPMILIVDDDTSIRSILQFKLKTEGYQTTECENGRQALQHLRFAQALPDLIILDLRMPEMDGWQFRKHQKEDSHIAHIPIIVISTPATLEKDLRNIDAVAFIKKPIEFNFFMNVIKRHCPITQKKAA